MSLPETENMAPLQPMPKNYDPCEYCKGHYYESNGAKVTCDNCKISGW